MEIINRKLNELVAALSPDNQRRFKQDAEFRAELREKAQISGLKEAMANEQLVKTAAENEAYELMHAIKLSRRGVKAGSAAAIPLIGSGMFAESLYKYALVIEDEKTGTRQVGFQDVNEIGGFTKHATAFRIKLQRDVRLGNPNNLDDFEKDTKVECEFTDPERARLFQGKKVYLDWSRVRQLAQAAEARLKQKMI